MRVGHVAYSPDLRFTRAFFYLVVLLTLFTGQGIAGQEPTAPPSPSQWPIPAQPDAADREQILAYWTTETGWNSELQLRNNAIDEDLTVTPALRLADGAETSLAPVTIKPQEVQIRRHRRGCRRRERSPFRGSLRVCRSPLSLALFARSIRVPHDPPHRASHRLPHRRSGRIDGVSGWKPRGHLVVA